ncbi:hypothetical protein OsJ_14018 [Oryza sativa Japonica Group]|uniref:Uncharacterized protein n=1 Tax=Oryza sativa subsp. japonica TaxID=39947 RepID=A3ARM3_ORYSJ|nr:hypothetical protein OsJ_14018 [Oryza sativa Japonica Group]
MSSLAVACLDFLAYLTLDLCMLTSARVRRRGYAAGTCEQQAARQQAAGMKQQAEGKQQQQQQASGIPPDSILPSP